MHAVTDVTDKNQLLENNCPTSPEHGHPTSTPAACLPASPLIYNDLKRSVARPSWLLRIMFILWVGLFEFVPASLSYG